MEIPAAMNTTALKSTLPSTDSFMLEVADVVNTTLDLDTLLRRVAELVRRIIDYEIFAILLLNDKTQELRIRFSVGHPPEIVEKTRIKVGEGVTGLAAERREPMLVNDVSTEEEYISAVQGVRSELAIPLIIKNRVIGVIDIEAPVQGYFTEEHKRLLTVVASRIAIAIENARLYTRVARQAKTLQVLNETSRELSSILHVDELLKKIAESVNRLIDYQMFSILLVDDSGTKLQHRFSLRFSDRIHIKPDIPLEEGLVGAAATHRQPVLAADVHKDSRYIEFNPETNSELAVPLIHQDKVIGVLDIEHTKRSYFTDDHVRTLTTLAAQIAIAIANATLYETIAQQEKRLEQDLALARELQFRLLPQTLPNLANAEVAAKFSPARAIGGDLYDFLRYSGEGVVSICIGDVSGKGAPAALYAGLVSGIMRSHAAEEPGPAEMLSCINLSLSERPIEGQFVSIICALWNDSARTLHISNSGLPRPIFARKGKVEVVQSIGLPLGLFTTAEYDELQFECEPGDVFVFFSDGISDARNADDDNFGRTRIEKIVAANCRSSAQEIVDAIFAAVNKFSAGQITFDDQTVVALKVKSPRKK
jgi:phosphoserine phosphatase RsbU/P